MRLTNLGVPAGITPYDIHIMLVSVISALCYCRAVGYGRVVATGQWPLSTGATGAAAGPASQPRRGEDEADRNSCISRSNPMYRTVKIEAAEPVAPLIQ